MYYPGKGDNSPRRYEMWRSSDPFLPIAMFDVSIWLLSIKKLMHLVVFKRNLSMIKVQSVNR
jgi:hypothetical protein